MTRQITYVGYTCPLCKRRVVVLSSSAPPLQALASIESECQCGFALRIGIDQIQTLETWKEATTAG